RNPEPMVADGKHGMVGRTVPNPEIRLTADAIINASHFARISRQGKLQVPRQAKGANGLGFHLRVGSILAHQNAVFIEAALRVGQESGGGDDVVRLKLAEV